MTSALWPRWRTSCGTWRGRAPANVARACTGLAELAETMDRLAYGGRGGPHLDRILEICTLVEGRGACRHPDGVARFVRTGLGVFADEVASHQRRGPCPQTRAARVLPVAGRTARRRLVSRA